MSGCGDPIGLAELIAYERGELAAADEERIEEHYFGCGECARQLEDLRRLIDAVADLGRRGGVTSGATARLIDRATAAGVAIRAYRLEPGDTVPCTCSPDDAFVAVQLAADLAPGETVDMDVETLFLASGEVRGHDRAGLVVDRDSGEVTVLYAGDAIRATPRSRWTMHLRARGGPGGERTLGPYVLDHTPWDERPAG